MSISDTLLSTGATLHVEAVHGELVVVLSGKDAGKTFVAIRENASDVMLEGEILMDPRAKRVIRFRDGQAPNLSAQDIIQTADGKKWHATKYPQDGYLTQDYELVEIVAGKDQA